MSYRAVGYARVSTTEQRMESLDSQEHEIMNYIKTINVYDIKMFSDFGFSGKNDNRPGFQDAISYAISNKVDYFIVHKLDRFSRSRLHSILYKDKLEKNNIKVLSVTERLSDSPEDMLMESLKEGMDEFYSANLAREVMKGLTENARKAQFNGGTPPLGFDIDNEKHYVINEEEALIVRKLFAYIANGMTYSEIIKEFNRFGYKTKKGSTFAKNSIHTILRNEKYKGVYTFNKAKSRRRDGSRNSHSQKGEDDIIRVEDAIPKLISPDVFDNVQQLLDSRKKNGASSKAKETYLLQGVIYCGKCGASMHGNRRKNGSGNYFVTYRCSCKKAKLICDNKEVLRDAVEGYILRTLELNLFNSKNIKSLVKRVNDSMRKRLAEKSESESLLICELKDNQKKLDNILGAIESGNSHEVLFTRLNELQKQKMVLAQELSKYDELNKVEKIKEADMREMFDKYRFVMRDSDKRRIKEVIRKFIDRVDVYEDRVEIKFNAVFSYADFDVMLLEDCSVGRTGTALSC